MLVAALALALGAPRPLAATQLSPGYRFGVYPYAPVLTIDRIFGPIADDFSQDLDRHVYLKTKSSFENFGHELAEQTYDIIFVHPFLYVDAADRYNYRPLARVDQRLTAVVMAGEDRAWHDWRDLSGRMLALPPKLASASWMVKAALIEAGLRPGLDVALQHYRTKISCLQAVAHGWADACALPAFVLAQVPLLTDLRLDVMIETTPINSLLFAVHERRPETDRGRLLARILSWSSTAAGRAVLAAGPWSGFVAARDQDYDQVRRYRAQLEPSGLQ